MPPHRDIRVIFHELLWFLGWGNVVAHSNRMLDTSAATPTSMFLARCSAAAVEPLRSIAPTSGPDEPPSDPGPAAVDCGGAVPFPDSGRLSGMAGTCKRDVLR